MVTVLSMNVNIMFCASADLSAGVSVAKLSYTDIQWLSNDDLNEYCRHLNTDISLCQAVKVNDWWRKV